MIANPSIDLIKLLRHEVQKVGSIRKLAAKLGVSAPYLSDVLLGKREAGPKILEQYGLTKMVEIERRVRYVKY